MKSDRMLIACGLVSALVLSISSTIAQESTPKPATAPSAGATDRRHSSFDPAEFQKRMMDGIKDRLGFKDDAEWTAVQPLVQKVMDLRRETMMGGMGFSRFFSRRSSSEAGSTQGSTERPRNPWFTPSPEAEALQKALDDNAPAAQVKVALEKYRAARKDKEAKLAAAQEDLRKVLTVRQEALASMMSLLP